MNWTGSGGFLTPLSFTTNLTGNTGNNPPVASVYTGINAGAEAVVKPGEPLVLHQFHEHLPAGSVQVLNWF